MSIEKRGPTALNSIGLALDECDQLGIEAVTDAAFRVRMPVADLRIVFTVAAMVVGDLDDLDVSETIRAALWLGGVGTVAQLCTRSREQLLAVRNLGPARVDAIERALRKVHANAGP